MATPARDLLRITLALVFICGMTLASLAILKPFLPALTWATMVVVSTWPLMLRVQRWMRNRRMLAVAAMTVAMLTVFVLPIVAAVAMVIENASEIGRWLSSLAQIHLPMPPDWLKGIPLVGSSLDG